MAGLLRVPRTRGALSGLILMVLGAWGALIPFVGPYFDYAYSPAANDAWHYTDGRLWLAILPGAAAFLGGLIVTLSANRAVASLGAWLAVAAGAWFIVGPILSPLSASMPDPGAPAGNTTRMVLEELGFFYALGAVIVFLAALALGRFAVVGVRELRQEEQREVEQERLARAEAATGDPAAEAGTTPNAGTESAGGWTEPTPSAEATRQIRPTEPTDRAPRHAEGEMPSMPPPSEDEKVGAGVGTGEHAHRRRWHWRHGDDET